MGPQRHHHHATEMSGRDPDESHRAATPLELLFDLTFVIAFGVAADELAHYLAEDHVRTGLIGFAFVTFAIAWAWINFSWFASAFDTDDWIYRLTTMVQMVGVLVLALGIPAVFSSIDRGETIDNVVLVAGYIVMRVAMVAQWFRAGRRNPGSGDACRTYIATILLAQAGWVVLAVAHTDLLTTLFWVAVLILVELSGPLYAETRKGGTPWHPHHIAERYGLLVIIALGEGLIGTMASLSAVVGHDGEGWSVDVAALGFFGTALTFGMWWIYFVMPWGDILALRRETSFLWGYGHIPWFGATVAVGAGLHVAAYLLEGKSVLTTTGTVLTVAVPVAVYVASLYAMYSAVTRSFDPFHVLLVVLSSVTIAASVVLAAAGAPMPWCIAVLAVTPWVTVVGYEVRGHRHNEEVLARLGAEA